MIFNFFILLLFMSTNKFTSYLLLLIVCAAGYAVAQDAPPSNPYQFNTNFNPSMAIIIVVLISAFFFMGFFSIYIRQCAGDRTTQTFSPATGAVGRSRRRKGLDPTVIETFPTFLYSVVKGLKIGKGTLECAVCLNEFEDEETLRLLPKCDHVFHPECIDAWLGSHVTCPVCRANLASESTETVTEASGATADLVSDGTDSDSDDHNNINNNLIDSANEVSIRVIDEPDVINPTQIPFQNRPARSGSTRRSVKFPRSHSTGHSVIQPGENCERFTLRLPEEIRKKIVNGKLNRTTSCVSFPAGYETGGSSRRGYRGGSMNEEGSRGKYNKFWRLDSSAKSERWAFSMAPAAFFSRGGSVRSPKMYDGESSRGSKFLTSVKSMKKYMSFKGDGKDGREGKESRPAV